MSLESMRRAVETRLTTQLTLTHPTVKIKYENVKFVQPKNVPYVSVFIIEGDSFQANLGKSFTERHIGIVQIDIMTPEGVGTNIRNQLADRIGAIFRRYQESLLGGGYVHFRTPRNTPLGNEGLFDKMAVSIPYIRDEKYID